MEQMKTPIAPNAAHRFSPTPGYNRRRKILVRPAIEPFDSGSLSILRGSFPHGLETFSDKLAGDSWICLPARGLHHLSYDESHDLLLAAKIFLDGPGLSDIAC